MKRPISLTLYFLATLVFGSLIGILFYILYFNSIILVAGETVKFSKDILAFAFKDIIPVIIILSPVSMIIYKARHKGNPVSSAIVYAFLCVFVWIFLLPMQMSLAQKICKNTIQKTEFQNSKEISGGYFRKIGSSTFFFIENSKNQKVRVIEISNSNDPNFFAKEEEISVASDSEFANYSRPYRDSLVKNNSTNLTTNSIHIFKNLNNRAFEAFNNGFVAWICFCSLGLLMCSMYAFLQISEWKLINIFTSLLLFFSVIFVNNFYFSPIMDRIRASLYELFYKGGIFAFISNKGVDVPLTFANIILTAIALTCGILISKLNKAKQALR